MKLQIAALLLAIIIGSTMTVEANLRAEMSPICKFDAETGAYHKHMVKHDRIDHFVGLDHQAVAGRCGPENCEILCKGFKHFVSTGAGETCKCTDE